MNTKKQQEWDWDAAISLYDGNRIVSGVYTRERVSVLWLALRLDGISRMFYIHIIPRHDSGSYEAWLSQDGANDVVHLLTMQAKHPGEVEPRAAEKALCYIADHFSE